MIGINMFQGKGINKTTTPTGHSIWTKKCHCCKQIKLLKHYPWYPMKIFDSAPRVMDFCSKCANKMHLRVYNPKDFGPDKALLNKIKWVYDLLQGVPDQGTHDDRDRFNLGNGSRWRKSKKV